MREIRILLIGDDAVGKSSLITSLIKESFVEPIQHVVPQVTIPPEWTRENVTTRIVDSSSRLENRQQLDIEIKKADCICIVYAVNEKSTSDRISLYWLPYIRRLGRNVPVVLVGNKIDTRGVDITNNELEEQIMPIMNEFKEVETCVECSAKQPLNVSEVFYFAQKAVLHPTAPLYDSRGHFLKPACIDALRRIFKLCDVDKNQILDDTEIDNFQIKCFGSPLQKHELESVKQIVQDKEPEGVIDDGLTEIGFIFLHTLFIQRGRLETTWTVLRTFGYGDDLTLREDFLFPEFPVNSDYTAELSFNGYQFLTDLFQIFDKDNDGALNAKELDELFSTAPGVPWGENGTRQCVTEHGCITLQGYLAQWSMTTLLDYKVTLSYMAYLGFFDSDTTKSLKLVRRKKPMRSGGKLERTVFLSYVLGAAGSGKTTIMNSFINREYSKNYEPTTGHYSVVNSVEIGGSEKYLVMQEFGPNIAPEILQNKKKMDTCDLLCMVYDSADPNSFAYVASLREKYKLDHLPIIFISTKSDLDLVAQRYQVQPDAYCRSIGLPVPTCVSLRTGETADLFNKLTEICIHPYIRLISSASTPGYYSPNNKKFLNIIAVTAVSVGIGAIIFGVWYRFRSNS